MRVEAEVHFIPSESVCGFRANIRSSGDASEISGVKLVLVHERHGHCERPEYSEDEAYPYVGLGIALLY